MVYVCLVGSYACSDQVAFGADMLLVVTVEPLIVGIKNSSGRCSFTALLTPRMGAGLGFKHAV